MDNQLKPIVEAAIEAIGKNLSKAGNALTTGYFDRLTAEKKAKSDAKIARTHAANQMLIDKMKEIDVSEEYARKALINELETIVDKRSILDKIFGKAVTIVQNTPPDETDSNHHTEEISDDWLNRFRESACEKSSEEAQELFSKVLAGEIRKPGSFSLRSLTTLADMDQNVAQHFKVFCSLCLVKLGDYPSYINSSILNIKDARIPYMNASMGDVHTLGKTEFEITERDRDKLSRYADMSQAIYNTQGLGFNEFQLLSEYGLIESSSHMEYNYLWYDNEIWGLIPSSVHISENRDFQTIIISGYALTSVGKELFHITQRHTTPQYWAAITDFLQKYYELKLISLLT